MTDIHVPPSPTGVPGAVTDPDAIRAQEITFAGADARSPHETRVDVYEGAGHAFFADYRPTYRHEPAVKLWEQIVPFLGKHLGAQDRRG